MSSQSVTERMHVGFFGKLPTNGDFLARRLPRRFTDPWDQWLQNAIADSREQLGDNWLKRYLVSPIWRFALSTGICGQNSWCGVLMPSVDRVGRYYPLTLAVPLSKDADPVRLVMEAEEWFCRCEDLALAALNEEVDLTGFDEALIALESPKMTPAVHFVSPGCADPRISWELPLPPAERCQGLIAGLAELLLRQLCTTYSLWWTRNAEDVGSSLLVSQGLPPVERFAAMLDGNWEGWGWGRCMPIPSFSSEDTVQTS